MTDRAEVTDESYCPACASANVATDHTTELTDDGEMLDGPAEGLMCFACGYSEGTLAE